MQSDKASSSSVSRRGLIAGAGAAVLATSLVAGAVTEADAEPTAHPGPEVGVRPAHPDGAPIPASIASAPISGYVYRTACMYDFHPFDPTALATWGGSGLYTAGTATSLRATFELPAGVIVRDVEFYVSNAGSSDVVGQLWQFAPGTGLIFAMSSTTIAPGPGITATRGAVPAGSAGPFPSGSRLLAGLSTPTDGSVQINGVRVGFSPGAGAVSLFATPVRAYDSRVTDGPLSAASTRTVTLPASAVPAGASAVLVNITALLATGSGYLKVYAANSSAPVTLTMNYAASAAITNAVVAKVSSSRQVKVYTSQKVHVILDVTGFVS